MAEFVVERTVKAQPGTVFDLYLDHCGYAGLVAAIRGAEIERPGDPSPNGLGAIRKLDLAGATVREEVTEYEYPHRYSYRLLSGMPLDKLEATVTFEPDGEGTKVAYRVDVEGATKVLPVKWPTEEAIRMFMDAAAEEAERMEAHAASMEVGS